MALMCSVVSRARPFSDRVIVSLSLSLTLPTIAHTFLFLRSDLFVLSTAEQDKKKKEGEEEEKNFFFRLFVFN